MHVSVEKDIQKSYKESGGDIKNLSQLSKEVGGQTDFMIGTKYHPEKIFSLPSGLTIFKSPFTNFNRGQGVVGGPHEVFTRIDNFYYKNGIYKANTFFIEQYNLFKMGYLVNPDAHLLNIKCPKDYQHDLLSPLVVSEGYIKGHSKVGERSKSDICVTKVSSLVLACRNLKKFEEVENAASEILYRCLSCRGCQKCRNGERIELISLKEEVEQNLIDNSVSVNIQKGETIATLPLLNNSVVKLGPNKKRALAIYKSEIKRLSTNHSDKDDVLHSEAKLQSMGFVDYLANLPNDVQHTLKENPIQHYIPWRVVWNGNSLSTHCRIVFDASLPTESGTSLNDILAKGRNTMNRLVEILIRWYTYPIALHTDVMKMYNAIKLNQEYC